MTAQRLQELIWKVTLQMEQTTRYDEYENLYNVYKSLKIKWQRLTGKRLIPNKIGG